jgi:hypothetical protein
MIRCCRILVLVLIGFYAVAGGMIPSPLAAAGSNCVINSAGVDDCPSGCDSGCPPAMCFTAPYAVPDMPRAAATRIVRFVAYQPAAPARLTPFIPDPAIRPPNV